MKITHENWEAFLFSLPPYARFNYSNSCGCIIHEFYKRAGFDGVIVDPRKVYKRSGDVPMIAEIPEWLLNGCGIMETRADGTEGWIVAGNMQRRWRERFPETEIEVATVEASKAPALTA